MKIVDLIQISRRFVPQDSTNRSHHNSHNAPFPYTTMHRSEHEYAHFCPEWCIVGCGTGVLWDLCISSIEDQSGLVQIMAGHRMGDKPSSEPMLAWLTEAYMRHSTSS